MFFAVTAFQNRRRKKHKPLAGILYCCYFLLRRTRKSGRKGESGTVLPAKMIFAFFPSTNRRNREAATTTTNQGTCKEAALTVFHNQSHLSHRRQQQQKQQHLLMFCCEIPRGSLRKKWFHKHAAHLKITLYSRRGRNLTVACRRSAVSSKAIKGEVGKSIAPNTY